MKLGKEKQGKQKNEAKTTIESDQATNDEPFGPGSLLSADEDPKRRRRRCRRPITS